jgi:ParB family chromosome partitioning protein
MTNIDTLNQLAMTGRVLSRISLADIEIANGGRDLQDDKVADLAASMRRVGMLNPIGIRVVDGSPRLVYGRHRLAAARSLAWTHIDCHVLEADDRRARMAEIAENLHRAELSELGRSEQIAEWLRLSAEDVDDKPVQVAQVSAAAGGRGNRGGLSEAAREIGVTREAARRAQTIAALPAEAKAAAKDLGLADNQSALLKAARSPNPIGSLRQGAARPRRSSGKIATETAPAVADADTALRRLFRTWLVATAEEKVEFIRAEWEQDRGPWKDWIVEAVRAVLEPTTEPNGERP